MHRVGVPHGERHQGVPTLVVGDAPLLFLVHDAVLLLESELDTVDGFLELVKARGAKLTVDFASGSPVSINDIVSTMASALGVEVTVRHEGTVPEYIQFRSTDTTMREKFNVTPATTFAEGLRGLSAFLGGKVAEAR